MKKLHTLLIPVLFAVLGTTAWAAPHLEIVTGTEWTDSSLEQKRAYLFGVGNVLQIERAMAGDVEATAPTNTPTNTPTDTPANGEVDGDSD